MKLPQTTHAGYLHAYKKGYRSAQEGKVLSDIPGSFRADPQMRFYYQMGWDEFQTEQALKQAEAKRNTPWKKWSLWIVIMVLGGLLTAWGLIDRIESDRQAATHQASPKPSSETSTPMAERALPKMKDTRAVETTSQKTGESSKEPLATAPKLPEHSQTLEPDPFGLTGSHHPQDPAISSEAEVPSSSEDRPLEKPPELTSSSAETDLAPTVVPEKSKEQDPPKSDLSLLSEQSREDLAKNKEETDTTQQQNHYEQEPVVDSTIQVLNATLTSSVENLKATDVFEHQVPKYVRQLAFLTQIKGAKGQTLYHRWIHNNQVMATIPLKIRSDLFRTWSSKRLSSAWAGTWYIEVLDQEKRVIYRTQFDYIR